MKSCSICQTRKSLTEFYKRDTKTNRYHAQCKACYSLKRRASYAQHYQKYGQAYRERARERKRQYKAKLRKKLFDYLSDKYCASCGESDIRTLEFDHLVPIEKSFSISKGLTYGKRWEVLEKEIAKCQILCANCHKIRTAEQFGWYRHIKQ